MKNSLGAQGSQTAMRKPGGISEPLVTHAEDAASRPAIGHQGLPGPLPCSRAAPEPPLGLSWAWAGSRGPSHQHT